MALILRHQADRFGLVLDAHGFAGIDDLLRAIRSSDRWEGITREDVLEVVRRQQKQRFEIQGHRIRACYGHSLAQRIEYSETDPPDHLYHGINPASLNRIRIEGLLPMERQYVHLSASVKDAYEVGRRRSPEPAILRIRAREAQQAGVGFYQAEQGIYLVKRIPRQFIEEMDQITLSTSTQEHGDEH